MGKCFGLKFFERLIMGNDHAFVIEVNSHEHTLKAIHHITNIFNIKEVEEHDSSYYLNDTYWIANQGFWLIQFFYTACLDCNNHIPKKIYLGVFIKSDILKEDCILSIYNLLEKSIIGKFTIIHETEIWPNLTEEEDQLMIEFLKN